jgi:RNA polymerase sigma factor (sigma-70 family)
MKSTALFINFKNEARVKSIRRLEDILAGCIDGNETCREWIYKAYYGYARGVISRYTPDQELTAELVNDSFVKVFKNVQAFVMPAEAEFIEKAFKGWLAKIASRTVIDFLRIAKNHHQTEEITELHMPESSVTVLETMNVRDILSLLEQLPQLQKVIFNMYEIEGFKHEEIATVLNIPVKNSRVYLARAKDRLRLLYQQHINKS